MEISLADVKAELRITHNFEDALITRKIAAAKDYIEEIIGCKLESIEGGAPAGLIEAWVKLTVHFYEWRGAAIDGSMAAMPNSFDDLLRTYRYGRFANGAAEV